MSDIDLRCCSACDLLGGLPDGGVDFVHLDPPWQYDNYRDPVHGAASGHYDVLSGAAIAQHIRIAYQKAREDSYCLVWCTFPKLQEWTCHSEFTTTYRYLTGGAWGKTNGLGVGFHVRGDAELWLLYAKGAPKPLTTQSNLVLAPRIGHSEKPQEALRALVRMAVPPDGLVLDLYAGASASMARACRATGRRYLGAEIDPQRHAAALRRLALEEQATLWTA